MKKPKPHNPEQLVFMQGSEPCLITNRQLCFPFLSKKANATTAEVYNLKKQK